MHILVVEDEVALCDTIVRSLKRLAYSVDYCYDGQKALDKPVYRIIDKSIYFLLFLSVTT